MKITLPKHLWYENTLFDIDLPDTWQVDVCRMNGYDGTPLTPDSIASAISHPIQTRPLSDLAKGRKRAVIIFDDMTRPTRTYEVAPIVIRDLLVSGIREDDITFVCALGTHGALSFNEFRKKLGKDIVRRFRVFNHNIYEHCVSVGRTSRGTDLMINREVAEADIKIGIGCVTPHVQAGFSGGGKLILPGVAHIDSISHYHLQVENAARETTGMGKYEGNILRNEIDEAAKTVGIDFFINVLVNGRGETTDVFAGDLMAAHEQAVEKARLHYATEPIPFEKDVVIANAFTKANEMPIALLAGIIPLKDMSGTIVIIADSPEGQVVHYLLGRWGTRHGGRQYPVSGIPSRVDLIVMAPYLDKTFGDWFANPDVITWTETWEQTLDILNGKLGQNAKAAVIPNATMQYYKL